MTICDGYTMAIRDGYKLAMAIRDGYTGHVYLWWLHTGHGHGYPWRLTV